MLTCSQFASISRKDGYYEIITNNAGLRLWFLTDDIIRIRASFDHQFQEGSYILTKTAWEDSLDGFLGKERVRIEPITPRMEETDGKIVFSTQTLRLELGKNPLAFQLLTKEGELLYSDLPGRAFQQDHLGRVYHYNRYAPEDFYYGFGEKAGDISKNNRYLRFSPKDNIGYDPIHGDPLYKHIPMYIKLDSRSKKAAGIFYHNTYEAAISLGGEISGYWPRYSYYTADSGDIDFFLLGGPKISDVVKQYTSLTGTTVMQPKQTLGYLGSTMYYVELPEHCDREILSFVDKAKQEDIPLDGFMLSSGFTSDENNKRNVFTWNERRFPSPEDFFAQMNSRGVMVVPNIKPGVLKTHPRYEYYEKNDCFIKDEQGQTQPAQWWGGTGAYFDFTNPAARNIWVEELREQIIQKGTVAIWNDNCEYDGIDNRRALCHYEGQAGTHGQLKPVQSTLMSKLSHIAVEEEDPNIRPFVVCRSGSSGIQRYAQVWSGDNYTSYESLQYNIATLLGLGLSGVANCGSDIAGFAGPAPEEELLVRWVQHGVFQPRFSIHSASNDNTVTEPWMYSGSTKYIRDAIKLRYSLVPYLYSLLWEAHTQGTPIMRPTFYEFQEDEACYTQGVDFLLGGSLLVATVVEKGQTIRSVYLPKGSNWYNFYTREKHAGGSTLHLPVDMSSIPLFIRAGAILPLADGLNSIRQEEVKTLRLLIAPDVPATFDLYDDDGVTRNYEQGEYLLNRVTVTPGERIRVGFQKSGSYQSPVETMLLDVIQREKGPFWVSVDGKKIPQFLHREKWQQAHEGWYYSHSKKSVQVKYGEIKGDYEVIISFEQFDLIGIDPT